MLLYRQPESTMAAPANPPTPKLSPNIAEAQMPPNIGSVENSIVVSAADSVFSASVSIYTVRAVVMSPVHATANIIDGSVIHCINWDNSGNSPRPDVAKKHAIDDKATVDNCEPVIFIAPDGNLCM
eukprot:494580_1